MTLGYLLLGTAMLKRVFQWAAVVASAALVLTPSMRAQRAQREGEWRNYAGDVHQTKYSPLTQINKDNVRDLRLAWRYWVTNRDLDQLNRLLDSLWFVYDAQGWYHGTIWPSRKASRSSRS